MPRKSNKREKLLEAARQLFHSQGFANTTLSDIAIGSGVPLGNVYYYFKTKQDLVLAVVSQKCDEYKMLFENWEKDEPRVRMGHYLELYESRVELIANHGCPDGVLSIELNKDNPALSQQADTILSLQLDWISRQFSEIGRNDSRKLALHMMTSLQGSSLLSASLSDKSILLDEVKRLKGLIKKV